MQFDLTGFGSLKPIFYFRLKYKNLIPPKLNPGDKIGIVAPSGRVFQKDLQDNLKLLSEWGLIPVLGKNLFQEFYEGYHYAGNPAQRISDFQKMLDDDEIKAVWFARGGYGAVQLVDQMNWDNFIKNPKWLIGYSDITVFHNHLNNWNIPTLHAVTVKKLNVDYRPGTFESLKTVLFGNQLNYEIEPHHFNESGEVYGKLAGGNLSIIYSLMGSISFPKGDDLILFIEDWNENWYHLNRMLTGLKRTGLLGKIKGMIVGSFTRMDLEEENPEFLAEFDSVSNEIIHKFMKDYKIPVCFGFPAGHIGDNRALILGSEAKLKVEKDSVKLEFI
jgi:muramoyltetrapeptide carboxypeptidase